MDSQNTTIIAFDKSTAVVKEKLDFQNISKELLDGKNNWVHTTNYNKSISLENLANTYNIHPLIIENIASFTHLPKIEEYEKNLFFTIKLLHHKTDTDELTMENFSFVLGDTYLFCFQENETPIFQTIGQRILNDIGRVRKKEIDYLFYLLIDAIVDSYYTVLQNFQLQIEELEDMLVDNPNVNYIQKIHHFKKQIAIIRRLLFPLSEAVNKLTNADSELIDNKNDIYFNDVMEHIKHLSSINEALRENVANLLEINMANMNNRMNSVMKTLTIVSTIFIPLTFLAGVYGMNFQNLPELRWKYSYFVLWGFMLSIALTMIFYMKRKKWF